MGTIADKLEYLINTKEQIRQSIISKGVEVSSSDSLRSFADKIEEIQTGGSYGDGKYVCRVVDYDGSILKEEHLDTGEVFTMPNSPSHDGLIFQEWATPVDITDNQVVVGESDLIFGATYATASGLSEIDIELTKATGLSVTLNLNGTKNWGDGFSDTATTHTYVNYGKYTISCDGDEIDSGGMFGNASSINYYCISARIGNNISTINNKAFNLCASLSKVVIPNTVTSIGSMAFNSCVDIKAIVFPNSVASLSGTAFSDCWGTKNIVLPKSMETNVSFINCYSVEYVSIPDGVKGSFSNCYLLKKISIPNNSTQNVGSFASCYLLEEIIFSPNISSITDLAFDNCFVLRKYDFSKHTSVPFLESPLSEINPLAKIIVPDSLYDEWISATNWSTYANYIYKASEVDD